MTKVNELNLLYYQMERSDTIILGTLAHFSHFRHPKKLAYLIVNYVIQ